MEKVTFSTLPAEIHASIAEHCGNSDLIELCLTSKSVNERCLHVLYRHVDLDRDAPGGCMKVDEEAERMWTTYWKQQRLVNTLLSHPGYGKHIRSWNGTLYTPDVGQHYRLGPDVGQHYRLRPDWISEQQMWRAIKTLTHVESVSVGSRNRFASSLAESRREIPNLLFPSATSVTLVGRMQFGMARSVLMAIDPTTLKRLCLDVVQERSIPSMIPGTSLGDIREDGRIIAQGVMTGLLTMLTGRCTALRTLTLRRVGQNEDGYGWHAAAEEASYTEWALFIQSVKGTVESFTFEQVKVPDCLRRSDAAHPSRIMDDKFQRIILPTILSPDWPRLTTIELRGSRCSSEQGGTAGLILALKAVHVGCRDIIVVEEQT